MRDRNTNSVKVTKKITRRNLLGSAAAIAAFTIVPRHVLGGAGNRAPSEKVNVAIIGTGGQGIVNMKQLFNESDVHIAALCDVNELSDYSMFYYGGTAGSGRRSDWLQSDTANHVRLTVTTTRCSTARTSTPSSSPRRIILTP